MIFVFFCHAVRSSGTDILLLKFIVHNYLLPSGRLLLILKLLGIIFQVPKIHWDLTTRRLLAMEFCEGGRIDDLEFIEKCGIPKAEVGTFSLFGCLTRLHLLCEERFCKQLEAENTSDVKELEGNATP